MAQVLRIANLIGRDQVGADRAECGGGLALDPLALAFDLKSTFGDIVDGDRSGRSGSSEAGNSRRRLTRMAAYLCRRKPYANRHVRIVGLAFGRQPTGQAAEAVSGR